MKQKTWEQRVDILRDSLKVYDDATLEDLVDALEEHVETFCDALVAAENWLAGCEDIADNQDDMFAERDDVVEGNSAT